jgi:outer membrane protein assembly factor BamB
MSRLLEIWRSWSVRRRLITGGGTALVVLGAALGAYLALKRPADVSNPDAAFHQEKRQVVKTVDWPIYGYDAQRTRYLPTNKVNPPFEASQWSFQAGKLLEFSPIAVKGNLYLMDKDALFYALSADRGKVRWKNKIGTLNASAPAYGDGRLFAVTLQPDQVVALEA